MNQGGVGRRSVASALPGLLLLALASGCATTHMAPLALQGPPAVAVHKDAAFAPQSYVTFSVFPASRVNGATALKDARTEKALLFELRNDFAALGYRYVPLDQSPDLLVTLDAAASPGHSNLPKALVPPDLAPNQLVPATGLAALDPAARPALAAEGWGSWGDSGGLFAVMPEYPPRGGPLPSWSTYTFANVTVSVLDGKTLAEVWTGAGAGIGKNPDLVTLGQPILWTLVHQFPESQSPDILTGDGDVPGLRYGVLTNDGKTFFPTFVQVMSGSPGWSGGVRPFDMVLAVDGTPAANLTYDQVRGKLTGPVGTPVSLLLWRNSDQVHTDVLRVSRTPGTAAGGAPAPQLLDIAARRLDNGTVVPVCGAAVIIVLVIFGYVSTK